MFAIKSPIEAIQDPRRLAADADLTWGPARCGRAEA